MLYRGIRNQKWSCNISRIFNFQLRANLLRKATCLYRDFSAKKKGKKLEINGTPANLVEGRSRLTKERARIDFRFARNDASNFERDLRCMPRYARINTFSRPGRASVCVWLTRARYKAVKKRGISKNKQKEKQCGPPNATSTILRVRIPQGRKKSAN